MPTRKTEKTAAEPPLPPKTAVCQRNFFLPFLAELDDLESFETMLFFSKIFPLMTNPAGGHSQIFEKKFKKNFFSYFWPN